MTARGASARDRAPDQSRSSAPADGPARPLAGRIIQFLAAVCALCAAAAFPASALFDLDSVTVRGNAAVPTAAVLRRAGIAPGDSALRVNAPQIRERLRSDPRIRDASIALDFPHRLVIAIRERTPVAALVTGTGYVLLGADGVAIARAPDGGAYLLLRVDRLDLSWVQTGTVVPSAAVRLGAAVAGSLPPALRPQVAALRVDSGDEVVLETRDGIAVRVGGAGGIAGRLAAVPDVLAAVRARGTRVAYVDVRFPGSVIVKPLP